MLGMSEMVSPMASGRKSFQKKCSRLTLKGDLRNEKDRSNITPSINDTTLREDSFFVVLEHGQVERRWDDIRKNSTFRIFMPETNQDTRIGVQTSTSNVKGVGGVWGQKYKLILSKTTAFLFSNAFYGM